MPEILNETLFEERIAAELSASPLYVQRTAHDFNIKELVDREMLTAFLKAQTVWPRLLSRYNNDEQEAIDTVVREYNKQLDRGITLLHLLREGITLQGCRVKFMQFKPDLNLNDENWQLYEANRFAVVRQMKYSVEPQDKNNELDLCILVNGLPIITLELKNEATGQTVEHGMNQYRTQRNKNNRMLKTCLVHFAMDTNRAYMTTRLADDATRFLPFNDYDKDTDTFNPPIEGNYATSYVWNKILQADSLLNLIQHFIKEIKDENGRVRTIFPRFHQLRCVRRIVDDVKAKGVGTNYLVEHSAGSGKSNSMAWLAHQLCNLQRPDNNQPVFDSVIMVTDRIVLDRNIADVIKSFETVAGTVKDIRRGSVNLAKALEEGHHPIIISTVQKFAYAQPKLKELAGRHFAVIIDEAHSAMGNEAAKDIRVTLSTKEQLNNVVEEDGAYLESDTDRIYGEIQASRRQVKHISYFAFTATPKEKTFTLFGEPDGTAFDYYTMKQAIDEGFIVDVLKGYTTYKQMFELTLNEKKPEQPATDSFERKAEEKYEKKTALRMMMKYVNDNPYVINYKANMIVEHFMTTTIHKMKGQAKAMVVTSSRADAIRYKQAIDKYIAEKYNNQIKTLVAFSGTVDMGEQHYTEEKLNGYGIKDNGIKIKFEEPEEKILVVAEKFQTGFDQPLLHTMYVDKMLGGVQCIQTLSRLNRCHPDKEDTQVIDFVNTFDDVRTAFSKYYKCTRMEGEMDVQKLYDYRTDMEDYRLFTPADVEKVAQAMVDKTANPVELSPFMRRLGDAVKERTPEEQTKYRKLVNRYVRQYGFLAQIMNFIDADLEKLYVFCKLYYKFLPYTRETLPADLLEKIDLDKYKIQLGEQGIIELDDENGVLKPKNDRNISNTGKEYEELTNLLKEINEPYRGFLNENDKLIHHILELMKEDPEVIEAFSAHNTTDVLIDLLKRKFQEKAYGMMNKYLDLMTVMNTYQSFTNDFFRKTFDLMSLWTQSGDRPEYDENLLKELMVDKMGEMFEIFEEKGHRALIDVVDILFDILKQKTIPSLDGINEDVPNALNNLYRAENRLVDYRLWYRTISGSYEPFLKKVYYLLRGEQLPEASTDSKQKGLAYVGKQFKELNMLYYKEVTLGKNYDGTWRKRPMDEAYNQMADFYANVYKWRNENAHNSADLEQDEINLRLDQFIAMYLFTIMMNATELEQNLYDMGNLSSYDAKPKTLGMVADEGDKK